MPPKRLFCVILASFFLFLSLFVCRPVFAAFNLTVTPNDGGFDLRFGRISPADFKTVKQLTLRVVSDTGKPYRVFQQVSQALTTSNGTQLSSEQFKMYPLINSNTRGTLLYREESPVSDFNSVIYSSDGLGQSDSFQLVYTLTPKEDQIPGSYYGRITYVLVPVDSTATQVVVSMNVYVDLAAGMTPVVEVKTNSGSKRVVLSSKKMTFKKNLGETDMPQVAIKIHGPLGASYHIYQSLEGGGLVSSSGDEFDLSHISYSVSGGAHGTSASEGTLQEAGHRQLLYTSDFSGSPDELMITYKPDKDFRLQKADLYRSKLDFIIETEKNVSFKTGVVEMLDFEVEIAPLFDIYVYSNGVEGVALKFGSVNYKTGSKSSETEVFVDSNMGEPYQIIQRIAGPMVNETGDKVPVADFTARVKDLETTEEPKFYLKDAVPAKEGESMIFASGPLGKSAHFKVQYLLTMHPDSKGGNYSTRVGYSLSQN